MIKLALVSSFLVIYAVQAYIFMNRYVIHFWYIHEAVYRDDYAQYDTPKSRWNYLQEWLVIASIVTWFVYKGIIICARIVIIVLASTLL